MSDMDDAIFGRVSGDEDPFKRILHKIPGFSGYLDRQNRRDADKLLRETIAARFEELWQSVSRLQTEFIRSGDIAQVDDLEAAAIKLRTFADRISRATYGYSSLFEAVKINQEELSQLYSYDASLLDLVDEINRAVDNVAASVGSDGLPAAIRHLTGQAQKAIDLYNRREEVILATPPSSAAGNIPPAGDLPPAV